MVELMKAVQIQPEKITLGLRATPVISGKDPTSSAEPVVAARDWAAELDHHQKKAEQLARELKAVQVQLSQRTEELSALRAQVDAADADSQSCGYLAGQALARKELESTDEHIRAEWSALAGELLSSRDTFFAEWRQQLTDIAIAVIARMLGDTVVDYEAVQAAVQQVLRESGAEGKIRVLIAVSQFERFGPLLAANLQALGENIEVVPSRRVNHGGCILETGAGVIDGRYEVQLEAIKKILDRKFATDGSSS